MPTYSYQCGACGHAFEAVQRMTEDPIKVCPNCGVEAVRRLINSANFILKGSGWYADLYSGGSNKKSEGSGSSGSKVGSTTPSGEGSSTGGTTSTSSSDGGSGGSATSTPAAPPPPPSTPTKTS